MMFLKLLLSSGLIFTAATASLNELFYQQSNYTKPMHYDIKLIPCIEGTVFYGECNISINILNKTQYIYLYSEKLCIENIVLFPSLEKYDANDKDIDYKLTYSTTTHILKIYFIDELSPKNYTLYIKYTGTTDDGGFRIFKMNTQNTFWIAATHFQTIGARRLFPCWGQPDLEATFNISIGHDREYIVLSNMPVRNTEIIDQDMLWTHFDTTPVMSRHLTIVIVYNNLFRLDYNGTITMWCRTFTGFNMLFAFKVADNVTLCLKNKWKLSNNISKVVHVAIPNFPDKGIAVLGLVLYRETDIMYDKMLDPVARKIEVAQLVGRKVIQEWFSNLMNPFWSDFWLYEGLTTFLGMYAVNKLFPDDRIKNLFVVQIQHNSLHLDDDYHMRLIISHVNSSSEIFYSIRASIIFRMLQHVISETIFWNNIGLYAKNTRQHRINFTCPMMTDGIKNPDIIKQAIFFWHEEKHYPVIKIIRNYSDPMGQTNITIQNFDTVKNYCIPITFTTQKNPNFNHVSIFTWAHTSSNLNSLSLKEDGWMIFNIQQIGYYRVNYDDENWRKISNYLNSDNYTKIHVLNRAQIIDDAFHFMVACQLDSSIFWNLTSYLYQEEDYIAWYPMFKALEYMSNVFLLQDEKIEIIKTRIRNILYMVLKRIKYEEIDDTDELRICLRQEATKWACILDDFTCKKEAFYKLNLHLKDPETQILPWWKEWTYCKGLMIATKEDFTWHSVYNMGLEKSDIKFLEFLACSEDSSVIIYYLNLRNNQNIIKSEYQNHVNSFLHIITKHAKSQTILKYILENFNDIKPKHVNMTAALIIIINNIYSTDQLTQQINEYVEKFSETKSADTINNKEELSESDLIDKIKKELSYKIKSKIVIRWNQIKKQTKYIKRFYF